MASTPFLSALSYALSISLAIASEEYGNPARHYGVTGPVVYFRGLVGREPDQSHNAGGTGHDGFYHLDRNGRPQGKYPHRQQLRTDHCHAVKPAHISMITVDIAALRPTAKGKRRSVSKYLLTPVTPYQRSG